MFLHYLTLHKNRNATLASWSRGSLTLVSGPYSPGHHQRSHWPRLRACLKAKRRHFKHLLWSSHTTGSFQSHFRPTKTCSFQRHLPIGWLTEENKWNVVSEHSVGYKKKKQFNRELHNGEIVPEYMQWALYVSCFNFMQAVDRYKHRKQVGL